MAEEKTDAQKAAEAAEKAAKAKAKAMQDMQKILEEKYGYKGKTTEIVILAEEIPVPVDAEYQAFGVTCKHEVIDKDDEDEAGEPIVKKVHILSAFVPESLAKEMIKAKRAHLRKDAVK